MAGRSPQTYVAPTNEAYAAKDSSIKPFVSVDRCSNSVSGGGATNYADGDPAPIVVLPDDSRKWLDLDVGMATWPNLPVVLRIEIAAMVGAPK